MRWPKKRILKYMLQTLEFYLMSTKLIGHFYLTNIRKRENCSGQYIPKRQPELACLVWMGKNENRRNSSDRIIVEKYFGRLCNLWSVLSFTFRRNRKRYDKIFNFCLGMKNMHLTLSLFQILHEDIYVRILNMQFDIGGDIGKKEGWLFKMSRKTLALDRSSVP